jgi:hypothetical protein
MTCIPGSERRNAPGADGFAFSGGAGLDRQWETFALLCAAPWKAWWAVAMETLDPENYRR